MEYCFSIAVESEDGQMATLGGIVRALHGAGYEYQNVKPIAAQEHWNRTPLPTTGDKSESADITSCSNCIPDNISSCSLCNQENGYVNYRPA